MISFEERQQKLRAALEQKYPRSQNQYESGPWLVATFDDVAIVQRDGKMWRLPYTLSDTQDVTLGDLQLVEVSYETVGEALALVGTKARDKTGESWKVRVMKFGRSKNGWIWTPKIGEQLVPMLERATLGLYNFGGAKQANHLSAEDLVQAGGALVRHIVGDLRNVSIDGDGIAAEAYIHEDASWLRQKLLTLERRGVLDKALGLSIDTAIGFVPVRAAEGVSRLVTEVKQLFSVDIVTAPAAEGRFMRAVAGMLITQQEDQMLKTQMLALIRERRPDLLVGRAVEALTEDEVVALAREAMVGALAATATTEPTWAKDLRESLAVRDSQARVAEALTASQLPQPVTEKLAKRFAGRAVEATEVEAAITEERETLARLSDSGQVRGFGGGRRIELGPQSIDKLQVAIDRLFGVQPAALARAHEAFTEGTAERLKPELTRAVEAHSSVGAGPRFRSLKEAYVLITGDNDFTFQWNPAASRASEAVTSSTWSNILGNTLHRRMLQEYALQDYGERNIVTVGRAEDFRTKEAVRMKYLGDLSDVDPQVADYTELAAPGDEKVSYAVGQKGNIISITRATILNDDMRSVQELLKRAGRSARRTYARFVWGFVINNSVYDVDGLAWFHATHANLQTAALSTAEVAAAILKLQNMTEPGSGEKLGLNFSRGFENMGLWLAVPTALWETARSVNEREYTDANFTPNPVRYAFGRNSERVIVQPLFPDASDWAVFRDPADVESIGVDFLLGREEPEMFLAEQPTVGQMFAGDKLQWKFRHEYGGDILEYRGAVKAVVA